MRFLQKLDSIVDKNNSLLCVGLDPDPSFIPKSCNNDLFTFNKWIIDQTAEFVCCFKPQYAFYAALGLEGIKALKKTIEYIHKKDLPVLLDAKRGDIGPTANAYTKEVFDFFKVDAVTVNPYLGFDSVEPFLQRKDKGIVILCRTSNKGTGDFQDLIICHSRLDRESINNSMEVFGDPRVRLPCKGKDDKLKENKNELDKGMPLYLYVAKKIVEWQKAYGNCLMVVGATWPEQMKEVRRIAPHMVFLVPGIGAQGGDLENTLKFGLRKDKKGLIISSSRGIITAENPREEARKLRDEINRFRVKEKA